jgi:undecaprenyl-diphosphatase
MDEFLKALLLGIIEGITEFLPVSSTGHLIIVNQFVDFTGPFAKLFDIVIQVGAIFSVLVYFRQRLNPWAAPAGSARRGDIIDLWKKSLAGVIPAIVLGGLFGKFIQSHLFNPVTVAVMLAVGGVALIALERRTAPGPIASIGDLSYRHALLIGLFQCLAMIPGTSRSAATIIGAMLLGATRLVAAEFSFFLAIPTLCAAAGYSVLKAERALTGGELAVLAVGLAVSFATAMLAIAAFMKYISTRDFKPFGWYRIALGLAVLGWFFLAS